MAPQSESSSAEATPRRTWRQIREQLESQYGRFYSPTELRASENKWRRIFAEAGFSVKGI